MNQTTTRFCIAIILLLAGSQESLSQSNFGPNIRAYGLAVPMSQVLLRSEIDGHVQAITVSEGQTVRQGDIVVRLECGPAQSRRKIAKLESEATGLLESARAGVEVARSNHHRISLLQQKNATSGQEYSEAILRLRQAEASLQIETERAAANLARFELADAELEKYFLRAPFDGLVVHVHSGPGESVSPSNDLVQIVSLDTFRVDLFLPISQADLVKSGQQVRVNINAPFQKVIDAKVIFHSPLIEAATGTTRVVLEIDNRQLKLPSGFTVSLVDEGQEENAIPTRLDASPGL